MEEIITISNSADLNKLKVDSLFRIDAALKYSEVYIYGKYGSAWDDRTISEVTHINSRTIFFPAYVSEDYVLISHLTILLNITFLEK